MKSDIRRTVAVFAVFCVVAWAGQLAAEESWESLNQDSKRAKINAEAKTSLDEVIAKSKNAEASSEKPTAGRPSTTSKSRSAGRAVAATESPSTRTPVPART